MAGTRRSTRQTTTTAPKYHDDSAPSGEDEAPKRTAKKTTRRKRTREDDEADDVKTDSPPPKKAATAKAKVAKPAPSQTNAVKAISTLKSTKAVPPPPSCSDSNRDPAGHQQVFWLLKAEPLPRYENGVNVAFSITDLRACTKPEPWGGVRNPQARNNMQAMRRGDLAFFYHSNAKPSGVVGILRVVEEAKVDETAFEKGDPYYDARSDREKPKWFCVGVEFVSEFDRIVDLAEIKSYAKDGGPLKDMQLVNNSRLSVCRVRKEEWEFILRLAGKKENKEEEE